MARLRTVQSGVSRVGRSAEPVWRMLTRDMTVVNPVLSREHQFADRPCLVSTLTACCDGNATVDLNLSAIDMGGLVGVWGPGNFDSDTVADGLGALTGRIVDDITAEFEDDSSLEPDEWGGEMVPAWLEILTDIAQTKRVGVTFPSTQVLIDWRDRYLRVWDGYIDELEPDEDHKVARRTVLVHTFERAVALAAEREQA